LTSLLCAKNPFDKSTLCQKSVWPANTVPKIRLNSLHCAKNPFKWPTLCQKSVWTAYTVPKIRLTNLHCAKNPKRKFPVIFGNKGYAEFIGGLSLWHRRIFGTLYRVLVLKDFCQNEDWVNPLFFFVFSSFNLKYNTTFLRIWKSFWLSLQYYSESPTEALLCYQSHAAPAPFPITSYFYPTTVYLNLLYYFKKNCNQLWWLIYILYLWQ
jgi:hypothetical protein